MVIELCVVQFWSEIILVISNRTCAARSFDFEITRMISDQLHSVQLPLLIGQFNRTVRVMPGQYAPSRARLNGFFFSLLAKQNFEFLVF